MLLIVLLALGMSFAPSASPTAFADSPALILVDGNPSCATLNASADPNFASITSDFGFKLNGAPTGTFSFTSPPGELTGGAPADAGNSVTISVSGSFFDWSSTLGIDAVIVKGGDNANAYVYTAEAFGDTGLRAPINPNNNQPFGISHIEFCYDYEVKVTKTAETTFTRTFQWSIDKSVAPDTWNLFRGDSGTSEYTVAVTRTGSTDSNWAVKGTITIKNNTPLAATITSVSDAVSGVGPAPVTSCSLPFTLQPGDSLTCSYSTALPDGSSRTNTATVTTTGAVGGGTGTAAVVFGNPTTVVNGTINVSDSNGGSWTFSDSGSVSYPRTFTCDGDGGKHDNTATIQETGQADSASVMVNCYALQVTKDARTSLRRTYNWSIDKSADQSSLTLALNQTLLVNYTVVVNTTGTTDSGWAVSGNITVKNPAPVAATLNGVSDVVSGVGAATVNCGVTFPYTLAAGGTLSCTYNASLPDASSRTNTATATLQNYSYAPDNTATPSGTSDFSGSAAVDFANATITEVDKCITVSDSYAGSLGTVCAGDAPKTFTYSRIIGPYTTCGRFTVDNTASFVTNDTGTTGSASWTVSVNVPCVGCTLTIGYWKTHAGFGPQADMVTPLLPQLLGTSGGAKTQSVTTAALAVQFLEFRGSNNRFDASNGINKLYAQLLAAKLSIANGADGSAVAATIAAADEFLASSDSTNWRGLSRSLRNQVLSWATTLDDYNNGRIGPGHCSE